MVLTLLGAGLLWFGCFGFNGGSAVASNFLATSAFGATQAAAAAAGAGVRPTAAAAAGAGIADRGEHRVRVLGEARSPEEFSRIIIQNRAGGGVFEGYYAKDQATADRLRDGWYWTGDLAYRDADGFFWLLGRVDDVLNVAGHRIGTMEVESALVDHPSVAEAAVVGRPHEIKGQAVAAFVTLKEGAHRGETLVADLKDHVVRKIGAIARPDDIIFAAGGKTGNGGLIEIAKAKGAGETVFCIGVDTDQYLTVPEAAKCLLTSAEKKLVEGTASLVQLAKEGKFPGGNYYGKTGLAAMLAVTELFAGDASAEVLVVASDQRQANITLRMARRMIELNPELEKRAQIFADVRTYWSADAVKRVTGHELTGVAKDGVIHLINSGAATLDATGAARNGPDWIILRSLAIRPRNGFHQNMVLKLKKASYFFPSKPRDSSTTFECESNERCTALSSLKSWGITCNSSYKPYKYI